MKIPKKIKVGGHNYNVIFEKKTILEDDNNCGKVDREKGIMSIGIDLIQSEKEVTFFHEVIHIINTELDEKEVDYFAQAFYALNLLFLNLTLKDNHNGSQIADLCAYPVARHVLNSEEPYIPFAIIKNKLYCSSAGKIDGYGLKIFP